MTVLTDNPTLGMYVAAAVALVVVVGLFAYLWAVDRRVSEIRRALAERPATPNAPTLAEPLRPQRRLKEEQSDGNLRR
ncbi:MAG: hypothetical protein H0X37_12015 [Herpetosiphonaceae bacterium]|nr:hypothetical protein [Herpetosiphonaceae bacterium]